MELTTAFMLILLILANARGSCVAEKRNSSAAAIQWTTVLEEDALEKETEPNHQTTSSSSSEASFSSLDSMLQWAIGHSDPEKLKGTAEEIQRLGPKELERRQAEMKELLEKLKMPSDADLMRIAIADLNNSSLSVEDHSRALQELLVLVEPIDNANDLDKLGGLTAVIRVLDRAEEDLRTLAAWVLGKASQNNPLVQKQVLQLGVLPKLMMMVKSNFSEEAVKAFYAVSALIRNNHEGQALFYMEDGILMLREIMSNTTTDVRLRKKSLFLVADLVDYGFEVDSPYTPLQADKECMKSVVDLLTLPDMDIQEKALMAIRSFLQTSHQNVHIFEQYCQLESALQKLGYQIEKLLLDDERSEFARDLEALRKEIVSIFQERLEKRSSQ